MKSNVVRRLLEIIGETLLKPCLTLKNIVNLLQGNWVVDLREFITGWILLLNTWEKVIDLEDMTLTKTPEVAKEIFSKHYPNHAHLIEEAVLDHIELDRDSGDFAYSETEKALRI